jgi:hypothetical protein
MSDHGTTPPVSQQMPILRDGDKYGQENNINNRKKKEKV